MSSTWIVAIFITYSASWIWAKYNSVSSCLVDMVLAALVTLVLVWPVHWVFDAVNEKVQQRAAIQANNENMWMSSMTARRCKVTSFVGTRTHTSPVWTCPDGSAYLQPSNWN